MVKEILVHAEGLSLLRDESIAAAGVLNRLLPLQVKLMALLMKSFELLSGFVELNLGSLGFSHLLLELAAFTADFNSELLDLEGELLDLGLVSTSVLFESKIVLLLLAGSKGPLFELLLVPVHFKFELVHPFVGLENHVLDVVEAVLLVGDALLQLFDFVLQTARLALGDLLHVLLSFDFLVFVVHQRLSVHQLHFDRLQVLHQNLEPLLVLLDFEAQLGHQAHLLAHNLVELLVLVVGVGREVLVQVILRNSVYNFVCHTR